MNDLKRGVTLYRARGGYDKTERTELVTILAPSEYKQLLAYLHKADYQAFVTVYTVNEVIGKWNIHAKRKKQSRYKKKGRFYHAMYKKSDRSDLLGWSK